MPYWLLAAAVTVAGLASVTWLLCGAVRKNCPYLVGRAFAHEALGRLAQVNRRTEIDMVEHDVARASAWEGLFERWLKKGAVIRFLVHAGDGTGESALRRLAAGKGGGSVRLFVVREKERRSDLVRDTEDFHFAVFRSPDQLWLEGIHRAGEGSARDCEYVPRASSDERWGPRREDFARLVSMSEEIELSGGSTWT